MQSGSFCGPFFIVVVIGVVDIITILLYSYYWSRALSAVYHHGYPDSNCYSNERLVTSRNGAAAAAGSAAMARSGIIVVGIVVVGIVVGIVVNILAGDKPIHSATTTTTTNAITAILLLLE